MKKFGSEKWKVNSGTRTSIRQSRLSYPANNTQDPPEGKCTKNRKIKAIEKTRSQKVKSRKQKKRENSPNTTLAFENSKSFSNSRRQTDRPTDRQDIRNKNSKRIIKKTVYMPLTGMKTWCIVISKTQTPSLQASPEYRISCNQPKPAEDFRKRNGTYSDWQRKGIKNNPSGKC